MRSRELKWGYTLAIVSAVIVADINVKYLIQDKLELHQEVTVMPGFFNINYYRNFGSAFGFFSNLDQDIRAIFFFLTTAAALIFLGDMLRKISVSKKLEIISLSLVLGGAIGNAVNRIQFGYVIDFLHFYWRDYHFPSFNLADIAICIGVSILFLKSSRQEFSKAKT